MRPVHVRGSAVAPCGVERGLDDVVVPDAQELFVSGGRGACGREDDEEVGIVS